MPNRLSTFFGIEKNLQFVQSNLSLFIRNYHSIYPQNLPVNPEENMPNSNLRIRTADRFADEPQIIQIENHPCRKTFQKNGVSSSGANPNSEFPNPKSLPVHFCEELNHEFESAVGFLEIGAETFDQKRQHQGDDQNSDPHFDRHAQEKDIDLRRDAVDQPEK